MTTLLAIDTSTGPCSVALWREGHIVGYQENTVPSQQSTCLIPMIENALRTTRLRYADLTAVAATTGPGSFTGLRTGLAAASGIAMAAGIDGIGCTTLEVLAFAALPRTATPEYTICAVLNAGKGECYYQLYDPNLRPLTQPQLATPAQLTAEIGSRPVILSGNVAIEAPNAHACGVTFPRADLLASYAASKPASPLTPFYIRPPDAKLPLKTI